ncbi:MAG: sensor histidine kinase, partial [Clostridium sp.]|nr:sensor histidine kinase [Clostridium sp.]
HKGMGIGLSLCKTIINAHGGQIQAGNHQNGAQFTFTLPDWREY